MNANNPWDPLDLGTPWTLELLDLFPPPPSPHTSSTLSYLFLLLWLKFIGRQSGVSLIIR